MVALPLIVLLICCLFGLATGMCKSLRQPVRPLPLLETVFGLTPAVVPVSADQRLPGTTGPPACCGIRRLSCRALRCSLPRRSPDFATAVRQTMQSAPDVQAAGDSGRPD